MQNQYLYHYGVKGMRWGVRRYQNKDGTLTNVGKRRLAIKVLDNYQKSLDEHDYDNARVGKIKEVSKLYSSEKIKSAKQKLLDADKMSEEFFGDENLVKQYQLKAARKDWERYGDGTQESLKSFEFGYLEEDADQGSTSSFSLFLKDRNIDPRQYSDNLAKAKNEYRKACEEATDELLGNYKNMPLSSTSSFTASRAIVKGLEDKIDAEMNKRNMWGWLYT